MSRINQVAVPRVLVIGMGDLGRRLLHLLVGDSSEIELVVGCRTMDAAVRYSNLAKFCATNMGLVRHVSPVQLDLADIASTAEALDRIRPDVVVMCASMQAARAILDIPSANFRELDEAQLGPWLPMHLTLVYELMRAVRLMSAEPLVVNACYPDAVGPALRSAGMAPFVGIGNIGNVVPGITHAIGAEVGAAAESIDVRLVAHHVFSHHVHRFGEAEGLPHHLSAEIDGDSVQFDIGRVYRRLSGGLRRQGGREGQQLTATSAARVILNLLGLRTTPLTHAPAPEGLPGGYPLRIGRGRAELALPGGMSIENAVEVNLAAQALDGITDISDGVVTFNPENMSVLQRLLGYDCASLKVNESRLWADELAARYAEYLATL